MRSLEQPAHERSYFVVTTAHGPSWDAARTIREQRGWEGHAVFLDFLAEEGFVVLAGPLDDDEYSLLVVDAPDETEVRQRLAADPWAAMDLLVLESVQRWRVWLDGRTATS